ncbi:MAG: glycosyltransferase family 39 protein [Candidatus Levybacteria bacterium]|nr:glycosyltransferase family 39 protein [Candidatus Levybacteria bacterium]
MIFKKPLFLFLLILGIAIFLRTYMVTQIPPGVNRDEASIGYTAYSLLLTGKDEYARPYPISFQSFGDWKLPLYIYATVPAVYFFGLNEFAVRIVSVLVGIGTVALTYFLVLELFKKRSLGLITMFLVAVAPWHIHLSRVGSESNTAVFLITGAILLFLKGFNGRTYLFIPSGALLALTYYTYAGNFIFTTLLVCVLFLIYRSRIPRDKYVYIGLFLFVILSAFIFAYTVLDANMTKLSGISIFGDPSIVSERINVPRSEHANKIFFTKLIHNKVVLAGGKIAENYLSSFSSQFLFTKGGDNNAHNIPNFGNMYLVEAPFLFLGFTYLLFQKKTKEGWLVLLWFLIAPIASSITKDAPHTARMFSIFPILPLVVALGIESAFSFISRKYALVFMMSLIVIFSLNIFIYLDCYFVHFPINAGNSWGIGYQKLNQFLSLEDKKNKNVVITHSEYSPYIYLLFYSKYDPKKYQENALRYPLTQDKFLHVKSFDRFEFRDIQWEKDFATKQESDAFYLPHASASANTYYDEFEYRDIDWRKDYMGKNTILVDHISYPYESRIHKPNQEINIIFTSYNKAMLFIIEDK